MFGEDQEQPIVKKEFDQGYAVNKNQFIGEYNSSARIDVHSDLDIFLTANFIYWQAKTKGLEFVRVLSSFEDRLIPNDFKFHPGFQVGFGLNLPYDNWDIFFNYTWLYFTDTKSVGSSNAGNVYLPNWGEDDFGPINRAKEKWKLRYNIFDMEIAKNFYLGTKLTMRPYFGLRGGWFSQFLSIKYLISNFFPYGNYWQVKGKDKSCLIGPSTGLSINYLFGLGFRGFGKASFSLLYTHFKAYFLDYEIDSLFVDNYLTNKGYQITPNADINLGLGWGSYFWNKKFHFDLTTSYDFIIFFNQNMMTTLRDTTATLADCKSEDLILQGLNINFRFDF